MGLTISQRKGCTEISLNHSVSRRQVSLVVVLLLRIIFKKRKGSQITVIPSTLMASSSKDPHAATGKKGLTECYVGKKNPTQTRSNNPIIPVIRLVLSLISQKVSQDSASCMKQRLDFSFQCLPKRKWTRVWASTLFLIWKMTLLFLHSLCFFMLQPLHSTAQLSVQWLVLLNPA